jgi:hypothetical protein
MSSSSRSIAAARSRRAGESQPPVSGGRPGTSIASHSAFAQQQMPPQPPSNNVRIAKAPPMQQQQQRQPQTNGLAFNKLSVSDAIGLVTLRLGRVEQFIIDLENGEVSTNTKSGQSGIPENSKIIDNSVLTTIINRLDALEKKDSSTSSAGSSASLDQVAKMEKDLKETKDLLSHLIFKLELLSKETNDRFMDFEGAITEIEKNMETHQFVELNDTLSAKVITEESGSETNNISLTIDDSKSQVVDLKSLIKQEFSTESNQ